MHARSVKRQLQIISSVPLEFAEETKLNVVEGWLQFVSNFVYASARLAKERRRRLHAIAVCVSRILEVLVSIDFRNEMKIVMGLGAKVD